MRVCETVFAVMASHCPMHSFMVVDLNKRRVDAWNSDALPIYEPGLDGTNACVSARNCVAQRCFACVVLIKQTLGRNLSISTDVVGGIVGADIVFIAVNTGTKEFGHWVRRTAISCGLFVDLHLRLDVDTIYRHMSLWHVRSPNMLPRAAWLWLKSQLCPY
jgi:hypothetical protein